MNSFKKQKFKEIFNKNILYYYFEKLLQPFIYQNLDGDFLKVKESFSI